MSCSGDLVDVAKLCERRCDVGGSDVRICCRECFGCASSPRKGGDNTSSLGSIFGLVISTAGWPNPCATGLRSVSGPVVEVAARAPIVVDILAPLSYGNLT